MLSARRPDLDSNRFTLPAREGFAKQPPPGMSEEELHQEQEDFLREFENARRSHAVGATRTGLDWEGRAQEQQMQPNITKQQYTNARQLAARGYAGEPELGDAPVTANHRPPYATQVLSSPDLSMAQLEQNLMGLQMEKQRVDDEVLKLSQHNVRTIESRRRKEHLDSRSAELVGDITRTRLTLKRTYGV
jgi:hypothetical protein